MATSRRKTTRALLDRSARLQALNAFRVRVPDAVLEPRNLERHGTASLQQKYKVVLKQSDEGFAVSCPGLPGCWSQGLTESETLANIRDAFSEYLAVRDGLRRDGEVREVDVAS